MPRDLHTHRRALVIFYRRYLSADRPWRLAGREALDWFPIDARPAVPPIGDPGSRLRRLYDSRARALAELTAALRGWHELRPPPNRQIVVLALPPR